jgi:hypothetical protein
MGTPPGLVPIAVSNAFRLVYGVAFCGFNSVAQAFPCARGPSMELCLYAWRPTLEGSSMGACGATAGNVKRLLPPRQSRGISFVSLVTHPIPELSRRY